MKTRCKFKVDHVKKAGSKQYPWEEVTLVAVHGGTGENESFAEATPSGTLIFAVTNKNVHGKFNTGEEFYIDITPV